MFSYPLNISICAFLCSCNPYIPRLPFDWKAVWSHFGNSKWKQEEKKTWNFCLIQEQLSFHWNLVVSLYVKFQRRVALIFFKKSQFRERNSPPKGLGANVMLWMRFDCWWCVLWAILPDKKVTQRFLWLAHPLETQKLLPTFSQDPLLLVCSQRSLFIHLLGWSYNANSNPKPRIYLRWIKVCFWFLAFLQNVCIKATWVLGKFSSTFLFGIVLLKQV